MRATSFECRPIFTPLPGDLHALDDSSSLDDRLAIPRATVDLLRSAERAASLERRTPGRRVTINGIARDGVPSLER